MRKILALALVAAVAACADDPEPITGPSDDYQSTAARGASAANDFVPGQLLVRFQPGANGQSIAAAQGATIQRDVVLGVKMLRVPVGRELAVARALSRNPGVEFAEPDLIRTFGDPAVMPMNDQFIGYKWDLDNDGNIYASNSDVLASTGAVDADMDWREAFEHLGQFTGSAIIGIMDSGILASHEDLNGKLHAQHDFFDGDGNAADDNGHGTHVAGIAAAYADNGVGAAGVAYGGNVGLAIAKVCGPTGFGPFISYGCPTSAIADGIVWAVDNGANVLNLSLGGGGGSETTRSALQYARSNDVLPFCAAGNDGGSVSFPGAWPECVAVSATDWSDGLASYSNFGPEVELSAPGGDTEHTSGYSYILSSYFDSNSSYAFIAGTSMASPQAAGLGALLHALDAGDDVAKLDRMKSTADDLGSSGTDDQFGAGRINVFNAVDGLGDGGSGDPDPNAAPTAAFTFNCTDLTCNFTDDSEDSDGSIASWSWDFGDGNSSTDQNPSHTYADEGDDGTYTVTLTVSDDDGATDDASQDVTVSEPDDPDPNAAPTASFTSSCTDLSCDFTDTSTDSDGSIASWSWDFGDGNSSTDQNPSHTYADEGDGTYTVTLTVTDDEDATDSSSQDVTVSAPDDPDPQISLSAEGYKVRGVQHADLTWSGATSDDVDIIRDGNVVATTTNDDEHTDSTGQRGGGTATYQVCEAGTSTCSAEVTAEF